MYRRSGAGRTQGGAFVDPGLRRDDGRGGGGTTKEAGGTTKEAGGMTKEGPG